MGAGEKSSVSVMPMAVLPGEMHSPECSAPMASMTSVVKRMLLP
ncbi:hypothetical protein SUDANB171_00018 [Streptomyces sp. enrichment culture]